MVTTMHDDDYNDIVVIVVVDDDDDNDDDIMVIILYIGIIISYVLDISIFGRWHEKMHYNGKNGKNAQQLVKNESSWLG